MSLTARPKTAVLAPVIVAEFCGKPLEVVWNGKVAAPEVDINGEKVVGMVDIAHALAKDSSALSTNDCDDLIKLAVEQITAKADFKAMNEILTQIEGDLKTKAISYLLGNELSMGDIFVYAHVACNSVCNNMVKKGDLEKQFPTVFKWFISIQNTPQVTAATSKVFATKGGSKKDNAKGGKKGGGSSGNTKNELGDKKEYISGYAPLPDAVMNEVVVRFPPEASGFLHIGHAKAAILNYEYAKMYNGKLIMRFDDTNPEKEKDVFEKVILEDLETLGVKYDMLTHSSDYFDKILEYAHKMIVEGKAYVDNTPQEQMRDERMKCIDGKSRGNSVEDNLNLWNEMINGTEVGMACCLRAKISMQDPNGCMRDPVIYRCNLEPHVRTGTKYKLYPTYDFTCPIVDVLEGVTHTLRTNEYKDRKEQFEWFCKALGLRIPVIHDYSRLNMVNTVMSKRKLAWFVEKGLVTGWDDPRFPTVKGIIRHGLTLDGLKEFIKSQGASRNTNLMEWDKIWNANKNVIDPIVPRYLAVDRLNAVTMTLTNVEEDSFSEQIDKHPKNPAVGKKEIFYGNKVLIEGEDASKLKQGEKATLVNYGNVTIQSIVKENDKIISIDAAIDRKDKDFKKTSKLNWVSARKNCKVVGVEFDHLISKKKIEDGDKLEDCLTKKTWFETEFAGELEVETLKPNDMIQIVRRGYFRCDEIKPDGTVVLFNIPDGKTKNVSTLSSKAPTAASGGGSQNIVKSKGKKTGEKKCVVFSEKALEVNRKIKDAGESVRVAKQDKKDFQNELAVLLNLKKEFKTETGVDWKPNMSTQPAATAPVPEATNGNADTSEESKALDAKIAETGNKIRTLKGNKAPADEVKIVVDELLALKQQFKDLTLVEWKPANGTGARSKKSKDKKKKPAEASKAEKQKNKYKPATGVNTAGIMVKREDNFSDWYLEIVKKAELVSAYPVTGCYVIRPNGFSVWETLQGFLDTEFKKEGVENCYFPIFLKGESLKKEAENFEDFAPEVAWLTKFGDADIPEPLALRPTSEAVMYPTISDWIQSHRDLPVKVNQWCNVIRWETKDVTPFLRTREFLWQEGHSTFATAKEADEEVLQVLELYRRAYEEILACPVVCGRKSQKEKFAGSLYTTTCEGYVAGSGRGIQGATSHCLGQFFSSMFDVKYDTTEGFEYCWQNSWGFSTRSIGYMIMCHSDNKGLVLPPKAARKQVVIVPVGLKANASKDVVDKLYNEISSIVKTLKSVGVRAWPDFRQNITVGNKFNEHEIKGIPLRMEVGMRDIANGTVMLCERKRSDIDKYTMPLNDIAQGIPKLLEEIQNYMLQSARSVMQNKTKVITQWDEFLPALNDKNICLIPWCEKVECEEDIKANSCRLVEHPTLPNMGAKSLCIPFDQPVLPENATCVRCKAGNVKKWTLFGRSY